MKKAFLSILLAIYLTVSYKLHFEHEFTNYATEKIDLHIHNLKEEDIEKMIGNYDYVCGEIHH